MQKEKEGKQKNEWGLVASVAVGTFLSVMVWMTLCHMGVQVYLTQKLGGLEAGEVAAQAIFSESTLFAFVSYVGMELILVLVGCLLVKRHEGGKMTLQMIGLEKNARSKRHLGIGMLLGLSVFSLAMFTNILLGTTTFNGHGLLGRSASEVLGGILIVLVGMVFAAVCEEVVYRGIIQQYFMKKVSVPMAIFLSTVCFSIAHIGRYQDIVTLIFILFPGIVMGYLYAKTKSLYVSIGLHYSWNVLVSMIGKGGSTFRTPYLLLVETAPAKENLYMAIVCIGFLIVLIGAWWQYRKNDCKGELGV